MTRVLLLCGGMSDEHEVSLASARSVLAAAAGAGDLQITPLVIGRDGTMLAAGPARALLGSGATSAPLAELPGEGAADAALSLRNGHDPRSPADLGAALSRHGPEFDVVFPLLHGPYGEDGSVQGLLKLMGTPFVGSGVLGSAVGMDKLAMKAVFASRGLPQVRYAAVRRSAWLDSRDEVLTELEALGLPLFVKPANLGSSIGITPVHDAADLATAIEAALRYDRRVVVEQGAVGARELEVAVLGNDRPQASPVGEIRYRSGFYDYETKYSDGKAELLIPAEVPSPVAARCRELALEAFDAIDAAGLARVDFFYLPDGRLLLNEINTMPGFTEQSMYAKLWQAGGIGYAELVRRLVALAGEAR